MRRYFLLLLLAPLCVMGGLRTPTASPGQIHFLRGESAALHGQPSPDSPVLRRLSKGDRLIEFQRRGTWIKVGVFGAVGLEGWLPRDSLAPGPPARTAVSGAVTPRDIPQAAQPPILLLDVSGTPALQFTLSCTLIDAAGGSHQVKRVGSLPKRYTFEGVAVSCKVRKTDAFGRLIATLSDGGHVVARRGTRAAFNFVRVRSDGPWGSARGQRGAVRLFLVDRRAEQRGPVHAPQLTPRPRAPGG